METTGLLPRDLEATIRSLPRRYREALASLRGARFEHFVTRPGPLNRSILALSIDTTRTLGIIDRAVEIVITHEAPRVDPAVIDRTRRDYSLPQHRSVDDVLADLSLGADGLADRLHALGADRWLRRTAARSDSLGESQSFDIRTMAAEAASTGIDNLREIEAIVALLTREPR